MGEDSEIGTAQRINEIIGKHTRKTQTIKNEFSVFLCVETFLNENQDSKFD